MKSLYTVKYGKDSGSWYVGVACNGVNIAPVKRGIKSGATARREALWLQKFYEAESVTRRDAVSPYFVYLNGVRKEHTAKLWQSDCDRYAAQGCRIVVEKLGKTWFVSMRSGDGNGNIYRWSCANYQEAVKLGNWSASKIGTVAKKVSA
jgi:hypothetical protein